MAAPDDDDADRRPPPGAAAASEPGAASDASSDASGGLANLRAVDAVSRSRDELSSQLSADEIEQLSRWFGKPSFTEIADTGADGSDADIAAFDGLFANVPGFYIAPEDLKRTVEARQRAMAAVEPAFLDYLERHLGSGDALRSFHPSIEPTLTPERFERRFVTHAAIDVTEIATPEWLTESMSECVPQALLRDLHRPEFERSMPDPSFDEVPVPPFDPQGDVRAAIATRYRFVETPPALAQADEALLELAQAKAQPWSEIRTANRRVTE